MKLLLANLKSYHFGFLAKVTWLYTTWLTVYLYSCIFSFIGYLVACHCSCCFYTHLWVFVCCFFDCFLPCNFWSWRLFYQRRPFPEGKLKLYKFNKLKSFSKHKKQILENMNRALTMRKLKTRTELTLKTGYQRKC